MGNNRVDDKHKESFRLITTKINSPRIRGDLISRPHLIEGLNKGLDCKLTLISAPSGYGKTTLVADWLRSVNQPVSWYSLDHNDNELVIFLRYLIAAVQCAFVDIGHRGLCTETTSLLSAPTLPPVHILGTTFINDLSNLPQKMILVLDDIHLLGDTSVYEFINLLLDHLPQNIHIVIIGRTDPNLPIPRLRVQGEINDIRMTDLRFTTSEIQEYFVQVVDPNFDESSALILYDRTEGWVTGLRLAAISLQSQKQTDFVKFSENFSGDQNQVVSYLTDEVLDQQSQSTQFFLKQTALLDRFSAPLAAVLCGYSEAECKEIIEQLEAIDLFIISLDDEHRWYRYHHLFQDFLRYKYQTEIKTAEVQEKHVRAARWLADHGFLEEALQHFLDGMETRSAARLIEEQVHKLLNLQEWRTLERWLNLLPRDTIDKRPALVLAQAWILHNQYQLLAIPDLLEKAQALLENVDLIETQRQWLWGELDALNSFIWLVRNDYERTRSAAQSALERIPPSHSFVYGYAHLTYGLADFFLNGDQEVSRFLYDQLDRYGAASSLFTARVLETLECIKLYAGRLGSLTELSQRRLTVADNANLPIDIGWAHLFMGTVHYEWNNLDTAREHFSAAAGLKNRIHFRVYHDSMVGLARIQQAKGDWENASQTIESLLRETILTENNLILPETYAFRAQLALRRGDMDMALNWLGTTDPGPPMWAFVASEIPVFTKVKVLLSARTETNIDEATKLLESTLVNAEKFNHTFRQIELLAMLAIAYQAQGRSANALEFLSEAIRRGKRGRFKRTFIDLGPIMAKLLFQLVDLGFEIEYLGSILADYSVDESAHEADDDRREQKRGIQVTTANQIFTLTTREREILSLLQDGYTNKEIALELSIAIGTVKRHTVNIYSKMGVQNRRQAVKLAEYYHIRS